MSYRNPNDWNPQFLEWINNSVYAIPFNKDKLKPTYQSDFFRWSIAEEAFCTGVRFGLFLKEEEK